MSINKLTGLKRIIGTIINKHIVCNLYMAYLR